MLRKYFPLFLALVATMALIAVPVSAIANAPPVLPVALTVGIVSIQAPAVANSGNVTAPIVNCFSEKSHAYITAANSGVVYDTKACTLTADAGTFSAVSTVGDHYYRLGLLTVRDRGWENEVAYAPATPNVWGESGTISV